MAGPRNLKLRDGFRTNHLTKWEGFQKTKTRVPEGIVVFTVLLIDDVSLVQ